MLARKDDRSRSKKKNYRKTTIEHLLIDIVQILSGVGIEKNNSGHWSLIAPIDIYLSILWNFISKRWPIVFLGYRKFCCSLSPIKLTM